MAHEETTDLAQAHRASRRSTPERHYHHGRNPAAWTGVTLAGVGFVLGSIAAVTGPTWWLVWVSAALVLIGLVAGGLLKAAGFGNN